MATALIIDSIVHSRAPVGFPARKNLNLWLVWSSRHVSDKPAAHGSPSRVKPGENGNQIAATTIRTALACLRPYTSKRGRERRQSEVVVEIVVEVVVPLALLRHAIINNRRHYTETRKRIIIIHRSEKRKDGNRSQGERT